MTQPAFVPITESQRLRPVMAQPVPTRPVEKVAGQRSPEPPVGDLLGSPGPDQGFALLLAHRMADRIILGEGEDRHDVEVGAALVACRRASIFGRAPSVYDLEVALGLFGFLTAPSAALVERRRPLFQSIGHSYAAQRELVDIVPERSLRLSPAEAAAKPIALA